MPPPSTRRSDRNGTCANFGLFTSALNSVFTPVIAVNGYLRSVLTNPGMSRGLGISTFSAPSVMKTRQFAVSEKMW